MSHNMTTEMLQSFEEYLHFDEKSTNTIEKYMRDLKRFFAFLNGRCVDKNIVIEYKNAISNTYAISSANSMIAAVNAFLKHMGWVECCVKQHKIQRQAYCSEEKELTRQEYIRLVKTAKAQGNEKIKSHYTDNLRNRYSYKLTAIYHC